MLRVLLCLPAATRWPLQSALGDAGATTEPIDDLSRGLRATTTSFDVAILDGATKSLTLKWAITELKKRNPKVRIFTLGGSPAADTEALDASASPVAIARQLTGAREQQRDFEETGPRVEYRPLFFVDALRHGAPRWIVGTEDEEHFDLFLALVSSLGGVPPSDAVPALLDFGRDEACAWAAFAPLPAGCELLELNRVLRHERTQLRVGTIAYLGLRVCEALTALHGAHVRHGMVRSFAIWCPEDGPPLLRLAAVGELLEGDRLVSRRSMIGSPRRYDDLSPEQWLSHEPGDLRTDLYQLGHLLYEYLTGCAPFLSTPHDRPITPPSEHRPEVPKPLSDLVVALLARDPGARPSLAQVQIALALSEEAPGVAGDELAAVRRRWRRLLGG